MDSDEVGEVISPLPFLGGDWYFFELRQLCRIEKWIVYATRLLLVPSKFFIHRHLFPAKDLFLFLPA